MSRLSFVFGVGLWKVCFVNELKKKRGKKRKEMEWVHSVSVSLAFRQMRLPPQPLGTTAVAAAKHPSAAPTSRPHPSLSGPTCSCSSQASLHFTCLTCPGRGCHVPTQSPLLASACVYRGGPKRALRR